jgi:hypothetical protein
VLAQPITFAYQSDLKAVGLKEVMHGGTSSVGAQIRRRHKPLELRLRDRSGLGYIKKPTSYHLLGATADFPAFGEGIPAKGGVQGYMPDRLSNLDTRSPNYGMPSSLLRKEDASVPSYFERRTKAGVAAAVREAAHQRTIEDIKNVLNNNGLCYDNYTFDRKGGYTDNFALSPDLFDGLDWTRAGERHARPHPVRHAPCTYSTPCALPGVTASQDLQHTSYLGPIPHHGYYTNYYFISCVGFFNRAELNEVLAEYSGPPGFCVPKFGEYVEKGTKHTLPYTNGKLHFTSSQARHWTEHSRIIYEMLFARKVCTWPLHSLPQPTTATAVERL